MSAFADHPGTQVLWCLRRKRSDVRCVLYLESDPVEVQVFQDADVVLKEQFAARWMALNWAHEYRERLKEHGWQDGPENCSPSSAA